MRHKVTLKHGKAALRLTDAEALFASAEHWLDLYDRFEKGLPVLYLMNGSYCQCCLRAAAAASPHVGVHLCPGCPIAKLTKETQCNETPYLDARFAGMVSSSLNMPFEKRLAKIGDEYSFLVDLAFRVSEEDALSRDRE